MATVYKRGGRGNRKGWYYIAYQDHTGKRITRSARTTDKAAAERIAAKLEADAALRREGVIDPTMDIVGRESKRSLEDHLTDYELKLRAAGRTDDHVLRTIGFIRKITESQGFVLATDITADGVYRYASTLKDQRRSARTIQAHLTAIKSFTCWLTEQNKLLRNPLNSVKKPNPKVDRRHRRRILLPEEWQWLRSSLMVAKTQYGISANERFLLYWTAIQTGLRANELRGLTRGNLFLDAKSSYITCDAGETKNRKAAQQFIDSELAEALRQHVSKKSPQAPVFTMPHETNVARMLRNDLAHARKEWLSAAKHDPEERLRREQSDFLSDLNHSGQQLDFHSLRHTTGACFAMSGSHPKVVQTVMRHSTITLTMDTYGHLFPGQEAQAVTDMVALLGHKIKDQWATGTDGVGISQSASSPRAGKMPLLQQAQGILETNPANKVQRQAQRAGREEIHFHAEPCNEINHGEQKRKSPEPFPLFDLGDSMQASAVT